MADGIKMFILLLYFYHCTVASNQLERQKESALYCETEHFMPSCDRPDEVLVITHAKYGRMSLNRCISRDYGFVGCGADVSNHLHNICSGRYNCGITIPDAALEEEITNCGKDLRYFLNATYKCVKVENSACHACLRGSHHRARVTSQEGYISSVTSATPSRCGTAECPWHIEVKPGQKINVVLEDFGYGSDEISYNLPESCFRYAVIKEKSASRDTPICAGHKREWTVYTSVSNSIEIHIVSPEAFKDKAFLIHYQALGCPDITPPEYASTKRTDTKLEIQCEFSNDKWVRRCEGHTWQGRFGTCPPGPAAPSPAKPPVPSLPLGVLIAIVVGIALVIGSLILTVGIVCLKRYHARSPLGPYYYRAGHDYDYPIEMTGTGPGELYIAPKPTQQTHEPSKYQPVMLPNKPGRNWYHRKADMQSRPLPSLPNIAEASASASTISRSDDDAQTLHTAAEVHCSNAERRYLTNPRPSGSRQPTAVSTSAAAVPGTKSNRTTSRDDPQYFLLEHNRNNQDRGESKSDDPAFHRMRAARLAQQAINKQTSAAKPEIAPKPKIKLDLGKTGATSTGVAPAAVTSSEQKSPEEENAENMDKEVNFNSSCHEIPLRPSRFTAHNVNNTRTENTTGKTSWP